MESPSRRDDVILPFKKNYFNFKTATAKLDIAVGGGGGGRESHLSYIQEGLCYLLTGTTPIVRARVCVCRCGLG